jgi:hypothetical protein
MAEVPDSVKAELLGLDDAILAAEMAGSWPRMAEILAPDYRGFAPDMTWAMSDYEKEFPKIHPVAFRRDSAAAKALAPGVVLLEQTGYLSEKYGEEDISGQYKFVTTWVRRGGRWRLAVEIEMPIVSAITSSSQ